MSIFEKRTQVYGPETFIVGEFDPTADGLYRNVYPVELTVKPNHVLYVSVKSDIPVDIVIAMEDGSAVQHKDKQKEIVLGPYPTEKHKSMGVILGVFRGDKANVTLEAWMERK